MLFKKSPYLLSKVDFQSSLSITFSGIKISSTPDGTTISSIPDGTSVSSIPDGTTIFSISSASMSDALWKKKTYEIIMRVVLIMIFILESCLRC